MSATRLPTHRVSKPWGRTILGAGFADVAAGDPPVGEIWFDPGSADAPLMVKALFTSERLSIQVHPDDAAARQAGYRRGKDEVWVVLAADPGATIALGPKQAVTTAQLRAAAQDGSIETLLDWRPAAADDVIYSPAGTVHALGVGLTLIEIQQNVDLTYRLYDYGRPRELHLDAGLAVSNTEPFESVEMSRQLAAGRALIAAGSALTVERWSGGAYRIGLATPGAVLMVIEGGGSIDGQPLAAGECWALDGELLVELDAGTDALFAYPAGTVPAIASVNSPPRPRRLRAPAAAHRGRA